MTSKKHEHHTAEDSEKTEKTTLGEPAEIVSDLQKQVSEYRDQLLRLAAEFDNFRKRSRADAALVAWQQKKDAILGLLPVYDGLERAIAASNDSSTVEGLRMIARQFLAALENAGLAPIDVELGTQFNPEIHDAMVNIATGEMLSGCVAVVLEKGYLLDGRLLRPARVGVSCPLPPAGREEEIEDLE